MRFRRQLLHKFPTNTNLYGNFKHQTSFQIDALISYGDYIDEACKLEAILAKKPKRLQIDMVGSGRFGPTDPLNSSRAFAADARHHQCSIESVCSPIDQRVSPRK